MQKIPFSFEYFPPKTPVGKEKLLGVRDALAATQPEFFSVTYGAGGSTQSGTLETLLTLRESGIDTAPHLSCIGASKQELRELLTSYKEQGIKRLVALRGDLPSGMGQGGELRYANELVEFIRQEFGDYFYIECSCLSRNSPASSEL